MDKLIKLLGETLIKAEAHLDFCGYGDNWERKCAGTGKLDEEIKNAISAYEKHKGKTNGKD